MMDKRQFLGGLGGLATMPWWLSACGGGNDASLRVINISLGYDRLDAYLDDKLTVSDLSFGTASGYHSILRGDVTLALTASGDTAALSSVSHELGAGDHYAAIAWGGYGHLVQLLLGEDEDEPGSSTTDVALVNASDRAVDVYITATTDDLALVDPVLADTASGAVSAAVNLNADTWRLRVTPVGDTTTVLLDEPALVLAGGTRQNLLLATTIGGMQLQGWLLPQGGALTPVGDPMAMLRVVCSISDGAVVSVLIDGIPRETTALPAVPRYSPIAAGSHQVQVMVGSSTVVSQSVTVSEGGNATWLVVGANAADAQLVLLTDDNSEPVPATSTKLRLVHVSVAQREQALMLTASNTVVASGVAYTQASLPATVVPGVTTSLQVTASGTAMPLLTVDDPQLAAGSVYTLFVYDQLGVATEALVADR